MSLWQSSNLWGQSSKENLYDSLLDRLENARESKNYKDLAETYYALASYESKFSRSKRNVIEFYNRSLEYYKVINDHTSQAQIKSAIAEEYFRNNMLEDAKELYNDLLDDSLYTEVVHLHKQLGIIAIQENNNSEYQNQLDAILAMDAKDSSAIAQLTLLKLHHAISYSDTLTATIITEECTSCPTIFDTKDSIDYLLLLAQLQIIKGDIDNADYTLKKLERTLGELPLNYDNLRVLALRQTCYESRFQFDSSYYYAQKVMHLKDSMTNIARIESIANLAEKYKAKDKSTAIRILELEKKYDKQTNDQQRRALYVLGLLASVLLLSIYFTVRFYTQRLEANEIISVQNSALSKQKIQTLQDELNLKSMHSMIEGQESERERISKDLHDSLGGLLSTIKLQLEHIPIDEENTPAIKKQNQVQTLLDYAVREVRNISSNLQPTSLKNLGLVAALKDLFNRAEGAAYPDIEFQHYDVPQLKNMVALSLYRIVQELLNNTIKHAQAEEIFIQLRKEENQLVLQYEDDGIGFDLESLKKSGMGLENITSRVNYLNGELSIDARVNEGVSYVIHIDIQ